jgi:hypothetical protein
MNDIEITEMTLRWDIEYEQSYLHSLEDGHIQYAVGTSELEILQDYENAVKRVQEATTAYYDFLRANAEWFI